MDWYQQASLLNNTNKNMDKQSNAFFNPRVSSDVAPGVVASVVPLPLNADRMILPERFSLIERLVGRRFTWDAACNVSGDNALCRNFSSPANSFLSTDVSGQHVWINPPFTMISAFLQHYKRCKQRDPTRTSACILLPKWNGDWVKELAGMQMIKEFGIGSVLFSAPALHGSRRTMPGIPWPVQIWYDPPAVPEQPHVGKLLPDLTHMYLASVSRTSCRVMMDTGASHAYTGADYAARLGYKILPSKYDAVTLADGKTSAITGQVFLRMKFSGTSDRSTANKATDLITTVCCLVLPAMPENVDVILGDIWHKQHRTILDSEAGTCLVRRGMHSYKLKNATDIPEPPLNQQLISYAFRTLTEPVAPIVDIMSPSQFRRAMRKGQCAHAFVVKPEWVPNTQNPKPKPYTAPGTWVCAPKCTRAGSAAAHSNEQVIPQAEIDKVLAEYADVFAEPTAPGPALDEFNLGHTITLIPGTKPPYKPPYRMSPKEREACRTIIADLLKKGYIRPSTSPYGAPLFLVPKPGRPNEWRAVCDWRLLNKSTVRARMPTPNPLDIWERMAGKAVHSTIDLFSGFFQLKISEQDICKTAFTSPEGHFEWVVLAQGLCNSPATFQTVMTRVLAPYINQFAHVYCDDIGISSDTKESHLQHIRLVLQRLREYGLKARLDKCCWARPNVKFLGHIVGRDGIQMDPSKVDSVRTWPPPRNPSELRSFLGLTNYFRRFLQGYSSQVAPLNDLLHKDAKWAWTNRHEAAFTGVKMAITSAPVLATPDFEKPFEIISDASIVGTGGVLLQDGKPIAFRSSKLTPAERNYTTGEQELLAVFQALTEWRCYVEGAVGLTLITDHNPLTYLQSQQTLSRRQARILEFMSRFNYTWQYRPGRTNVADPLSRHPNFSTPKASSLPRLSALLAASKANTKRTKRDLPLSEQQVGDTLSQALLPALKAAFDKDTWFANHRNTRTLRLDPDSGLWHRKSAAGHDQIVVPNSEDIRAYIMRELHDAPMSGHQGQDRTQHAIERTFWWPCLARDVAEYVRTCDSCQRNKPRNTRPNGTLQPLPIPETKWESICMDYITHLPKTPRGHDAIAVFVDRLTKMVHLAPTTSDVTAEGTARLYVDHVVRLHGVPNTIITDRGSTFNNKFWQALQSILGTKHHMSTAYHAQTDGHAERANRVLEDMLRHYIAPTHTDWDLHLSLAAFACNNAYNSSIDSTPFYLNYGMHPRCPVTREFLAATKQASPVPAADSFADDMHKLLSRARAALQAAQQRQSRAYDSKHKPAEFKQGDMVLLSTENIQRSLRRQQAPGSTATKLLPKYIGPFKVEALVGKAAVRLALTQPYSRFHNVFHVSLVKLYKPGGRSQPPPPPLQLDDEGVPLYRVERIIGHLPEGASRKEVDKKGKYLVKWLGYGNEHNTYEPNKNFTDSVAQDEYWRYVSATSKARS